MCAPRITQLETGAIRVSLVRAPLPCYFILFDKTKSCTQSTDLS